jgi:Cupin-like domain
MVTQSITAIEMPSAEDFVENYISKNRPAVVRGLDFDRAEWQPEALTNRIGDLTALVYGTLFDLEDVQSLSDYIENWFGQDGPMQDNIPYVRWYNKLRDVEFAWGDEAFDRVASAWRMPRCLPKGNLVVPVSGAGAGTNPVSDAFPYRGLLVAARGARTRMHRDPFCSDAVVCQFYGAKEVALYHPNRSPELMKRSDGTSFGGFVDVREGKIDSLSVAPDYHGFVGPGEMVYIPHGWLHDVIAIEDSVSITWNFVHQRGATEFAEYLTTQSKGDPEFEILQYFHRPLGQQAISASAISEYHFAAR